MQLVSSKVMGWCASKRIVHWTESLRPSNRAHIATCIEHTVTGFNNLWTHSNRLAGILRMLRWDYTKNTRRVFPCQSPKHWNMKFAIAVQSQERYTLHIQPLWHWLVGNEPLNLLSFCHFMKLVQQSTRKFWAKTPIAFDNSCQATSSS